ncbi:hypothetical protein HY218_00405 [Candidatus Saccharibacteria bacterium]|nr:hypothetical protein [Candidatus Saccharibacteria bacterium]
MTGPFSYYQLLKQLWHQAQDVIIRPGQIEAIELCDQPWCGYGYDAQTTAVSLGCAKLTGRHMAQLPGLWDTILLKNWRNLDGHHGNSYAKLGIAPHQHKPHVINDNRYRAQLDKSQLPSQ